LSGWTEAAHDGTNVIISASAHPTDTGIDNVQVKIKRSVSTSGKLFSRLAVDM